ncbi:4-diphosphocytidyl-2C-methyl-D-erythritol kinase [Bosea thiooxidans]|uniref:4-diphosphocytidyl-2-C-methyl-D-erythritol kinase n=1 Tax=Bosea thiooxidans TaxID=53254 RepID=A0A0Q3M726_9HYPH|nr:4-(cytidine 5'-diphospho)-2-C-methyl-D-erythritol kinase [Bosea thiooxidans]KQK31593.1 4-diphosphocytidyl-2C-methyl-D-erythritol kinase [Bosea thiooxidans]SKB66073.1 4-diphosphocytidyl-2-C-methyl-D-erythritol kinase [Bosea thiooxidans]
MALPLTTRARAKVNLDLRVLGRRADGYHELESLVAFAGVGDLLTLDPGAPLSLSIAGPRAEGLAVDDGNLVLRAAGALAAARPGLRLGRFHLVKRLPVASGIGGGSADAAAALRLLARLNGIALTDPLLHVIAARVGADVPVCLDSRTRLMAGIGERLGPQLRLPPLFAVLVNPGVAVETAAVFRALGLAPGQRLASAGTMSSTVPTSAPELLGKLAASGNDLAAPARSVAPAIDAVLERLSGLPGCRLARMSGSGATCFALFDDCGASAVAAKALQRERPGWWIKPTVFR